MGTKEDWAQYRRFVNMMEKGKSECVPVFLFDKYEDGRVPDNALDPYKDHISKCPTCKESYEFVMERRRQNKMGTTAPTAP